MSHLRRLSLGVLTAAIISLILLGGLVAPRTASAAPTNVYWVGGSGNWIDAANHWSSSSGGPPNLSNLPASNSNCHFDANSSNDMTFTVTVDVDAYCNNIDWSGVTDSPTLSFSTNVHLYVYGSVTITNSVENFGDSGLAGYLQFSGASPQTITTNSRTIRCTAIVAHSTSTVTLVDPLTAICDLQAASGTFSSGGNNITLIGITTAPEIILSGGTLNIAGSTVFLKTISAAPPELSTLPATSLTAASAVLQGTIDPLSYSSVFVRFEYGTDASYGKTTSWQTLTSASTFYSALGNVLQPNQTYHFRAMMLYGSGLPGYGSDASFSTTAGIGDPTSSMSFKGQDVIPDTSISNWFLEPDVSGTLLTNPFRPIVLMWSTTTNLSEKTVWRFWGFLFVLICTVGAAFKIPNHLFLVGVAMAISLLAMVRMTVFPMWTLVFAIGGLVGGLVAERTQQL